MTEISYMVREDWAKHGTAMEANSVTVRDWLGSPPHVFAFQNAKTIASERTADLEAASFITPLAKDRVMVSIHDLPTLPDHGGSVAVVHPYEDSDLETIRRLVDASRFRRVFVMIWAPSDRIRVWLDSQGATDLVTGTVASRPDAVVVEAASMLVDVEYNGLSSGRGKDAAVQLLRALTSAGYPLEVEAWLSAYYVAGGSFRHGEQVATLVREMKAGTKHRVKPAYKPEILEIIRERVASTALGRLRPPH